MGSMNLNRSRDIAEPKYWVAVQLAANGPIEGVRDLIN